MSQSLADNLSGYFHEFGYGGPGMADGISSNVLFNSFTVIHFFEVNGVFLIF